VGLLVIVSAVTFSIFYLVPRWAGATPETLATRYVGRAATEETVKLTAERLGSYDPITVQYWNWAKGVVVGAEYDYGAGVERCPSPCLGYSFITKTPVWPDLLDRIPVTLSLAAGASIIWLVGGVAIGVLSALKRGSVFDRAAMTVALAGVSLPIFFTGLISLAYFSYRLGWTARAGPSSDHRQPVKWAQALTLPWITLAFLFSAQYAGYPAGMLETMNEDFIGRRGPRGCRSAPWWSSTACARALTPIVTIFGLDLGPAAGRRVLTERRSRCPGIGQVRGRRASSTTTCRSAWGDARGGVFIVIANLVVDLPTRSSTRGAAK
jgi:peptide/nickel transport system permease protein